MTTEGQRGRGIEGQRDRGAEGQRDRGAEGQSQKKAIRFDFDGMYVEFVAGEFCICSDFNTENGTEGDEDNEGERG